MKTIRNYDEDGEYIEFFLVGNKIKIKIGHFNNESNSKCIQLNKKNVKSLIRDLKYIIGE